MNDQPELATVFRSADTSAREDAEEIVGILEEAGLSPVLLGDDEPGVPSGACEVRVPEPEAGRAAQVIAESPEAPMIPGDPSRDMDLETVYSGLGLMADVESLGIRSVLDANGIPNVYINPPQYPNLRFVVKVPKKFVDLAKKVLAEAEAAGPEAAEEAEKAGEE